MNKHFNRAAIGTLISTLGVSAMAAVPAEVTTALADLKTDGLVVAGVVLAAIVGIFAFKFIRKGL